MAEAKVFPMNTFVSCLRGGGELADQNLMDMLSFVTQANVDADFAPVACSLAKAWIYEQEPQLTKAAAGDIEALGQKISIMPLPEEVQTQAAGVLAKMDELKAANAALTADKAALAAEVEALKADLAGVKAKLKTYDDQAAQGDVKLSVSSKKMDEHIKKLEALMAEVDKVKKQGVVVAGVAGAAAGAPAGDAGAAAAAGGEASGAPATGGEPEADFGFGSNPFADSNW